MKQTYNITSTDALLITDIQKDFLPGGALPVADGDEIIPVLNGYARRFEEAKAHVFASRDWHPPNHISFKAQGGPWPPHCVQKLQVQSLVLTLNCPLASWLFLKATNPEHESYSVFDGTSFAHELRMCELNGFLLAV